MVSTTAAATSLTAGEDSRASAKSGIVYEPNRRSGAATNRSSARYPAANPSGSHSTLAPSFIPRPAMPRKEAADRYSPEIAAAFHHGVTAREATYRSDVVRTSRTPQKPSPMAPAATATTATAAIIPARRRRGTPRRGRPRGAGTEARSPRSAGTAAPRGSGPAAGRRTARCPAARGTAGTAAAAIPPARRTRPAPGATARAVPGSGARGRRRRAASPRQAPRAGCAAAPPGRSSHELLPQRRHLAPRNGDLAPVGERQRRRAVQTRPHLDRAPQVRHVAAVHLHEPVRPPALGQVRHAAAHQEALLVADHAHVVAVCLQEQDRLARHQAGPAAQGGEGDHVVGAARSRGGPARLAHAAERLRQAPPADRLHQVVERLQLEGTDRASLVGAHEHHRRRRLEATQHPRQLEAVDAGHADVEEDRVEGPLRQRAERLLAARRGAHFGRLGQGAQLPREVGEGRPLVVYDEHVEAPLAHAARTPGCDFGTVSRTSVPSPRAESIPSP